MTHGVRTNPEVALGRSLRALRDAVDCFGNTNGRRKSAVVDGVIDLASTTDLYTE